MEVTSRAEARHFIHEIRKQNGGMSAEQRERMERTEPDVLEMFDNLRRRLGAVTKTYVGCGKTEA
jgi:hypothetical protein